MSESAAWIALPGAVAISFLWRAIGVAVSGRIDPASDVFLWVQCVAYAMLAGLVSRMLFLPTGVLAPAVAKELCLFAHQVHCPRCSQPQLQK